MSKLLTEDQVVAVLRKRQGDRTLKAFAAELGISFQYLADIYARKRNLSEAVASKLGYDRRIVYSARVA